MKQVGKLTVTVEAKGVHEDLLASVLALLALLGLPLELEFPILITPPSDLAGVVGSLNLFIEAPSLPCAAEVGSEAKSKGKKVTC